MKKLVLPTIELHRQKFRRGLNKTEEEVCVKSDPKQNFKEFFVPLQVYSVMMYLKNGNRS